jgi:hypothetical protein
MADYPDIPFKKALRLATEIRVYVHHSAGGEAYILLNKAQVRRSDIYHDMPRAHRTGEDGYEAKDGQVTLWAFNSDHNLLIIN